MQIRLTVKWTLQDSDKNNLICIILPVQIVAASRSKAIKTGSEGNSILRFLSGPQ